MLKNIKEKTMAYFEKNKSDIVIILYVLLQSALQYYCLELGNKNPLLNGVFYTFVNILTIFAVLSAVYIFVRRWWVASLITSLPLVLLSIANYYTLLYRNSPISTQDIYSVGTTISVLDSYHFPLNAFVLGIIVFFALQIAVMVQLRKREKMRRISVRKGIVEALCLVVFSLSFTHFVYFAENPIKPRNTFVWSWEDSYYKYGYVASSIEVFQNSLNMVNMPEGYSVEKLSAETENIKGSGEGRKPDVILILNETFYDMGDLVELETDVPVMPFIDSLKNRGRAVVSGTGGGTNKSEYELLTSNSLQLMPAITPFNYLDFSNANSVVSYAKDLGYSTWGGHCAEGLNYKRGIVYPKLGFDEVLFMEEFGQKKLFGQRPYATDEFCYDKMLEDYEKMGDGPRLQYLLTIQNHGGWELNDPQMDTVHSLTDFGEYTDDMDEFLSCINETDKAFKKLTEYFEDSQREVIICMVGDHAPSFAVELLDEISLEETFALRSTPYVIWSNFEMEKQFPEMTSIGYLVPLMLDGAKMPMTPYYSYMSGLCQRAPVLTSFNLYKTAEGKILNYNDQSELKNNINIYFDMVYNNVTENEARLDGLFRINNDEDE